MSPRERNLLIVLGAILGRTTGFFDALLADRFARHVSVRVMRHAAQLDLATYEDPAFHDPLERARVPLIYRVHDEPDPERVNALREFLQTLDISLPKAGALRAAQFNRILARVKGREVEKLVNEVVLRTQAQAEYTAENYGHFGLNLRRYAHFTSPIRRYPDLVVHRALLRELGVLDVEPPEDLADLGDWTSARERAASDLEYRADAVVQGSHQLRVRFGDSGGREGCGPVDQASCLVDGCIDPSHRSQLAQVIDLVLLDLAEPDLPAGVS